MDLEGVVYILDMISGFMLGLLAMFLSIIPVGWAIGDASAERDDRESLIAAVLLLIVMLVPHSVVLYYLRPYFKWTFYLGYVLGVATFVAKALIAISEQRGG